MSVISYPIPLYANVPIQSDFYQPQRFQIDNITLGQTTLVQTTEDHDYVVGNVVRLIIPNGYGSTKLNGVQGLVISVPNDDEVVLQIDSSSANQFIPEPFTATITNATNAVQCVLTANNSFKTFQTVIIENVGGMTQLNDNTYQIVACTSTTITLNVDSSSFSAYTAGGTATIFPTNGALPQIICIGDNNSGQINSNGRVSNITYIPGSFINVSP